VHSNAHAYTVVSVDSDASGDPTLTLRNPYSGDQFPNGGYTTISADQAFSCGGTLIVFGL
jgi:hypothetical protein